MDRAKAPRLEALELSSRPNTARAIAWSCDAELAVATADGIFILLPTYPTASRNEADGGDKLSSSAQYSLFLQTAGVFRPDPSINGQLCAAAGATIPPQKANEPPGFPGVGSGMVTGGGAALGHVVAIEWSPSGLGCNLRPVLTAMTTHGAIVALGEHIDASSSSSSTTRTRSFKNWKMLWGLGARLPLPSPEDEGNVKFMDERITSFSWAKEVAYGKALLAYATDAGDVVIMAVQFCQKQEGSDARVWDITEVARFNGKGPHKTPDSLDPDFTPSGTAFSLKWSPWVTSKNSQTATLAYMAHNHVGFRRVTLQWLWKSGQAPTVSIGDKDSNSICLSLSADAFIEWENTTWKTGSKVTGRGVIATPFIAQAFEVTLFGPPDTPDHTESHTTEVCGTTYPTGSHPGSTNPITGLVIHHPDPKNKPELPRYSLVRLSATSSTEGWFETTLAEDEAPWPQWAEEIDQQLGRTVSRRVALQGIDIDSDSDDEALDAEVEEDLYSASDVEMMDASQAHARTGLQVHPNRFRLWGLAASPGDGSTAALVSRYDTQHPNRRDFVKVMFGWCVPDDETDKRVHRMPPRSTTEARVWEWLYGDGAAVPGINDAPEIMTLATHSPLRVQFRPALAAIRCVFCDAPLQQRGADVECENGHVFASCAASGMPIMAPGISRVCAVCELRCLKASELDKLAMQYLREDIEIDSEAEVCGGCGGKFVV